MKKCSRFGTDWDKLGSNVYSGTAEFGKDYTIIATVIACIFSFLIFIFGIYLTFRKPEYTVAATMKMAASTGPDETGQFQNSGTIISNGPCKNETLNVANSGRSLFKGTETEQVFLKPDGSCEDARLHEDKTKWLGIFLIIVALLIIVSSFIKLFFVKKYKGVAAAAGVFDVFSMFKR